MNRSLRTLPVYLMLIAANALPVYGAALHRIFFFQIIYLYWFESLVLIVFDCIRIGAAQGTDFGKGVFDRMSPEGYMADPGVPGAWKRIWLIIRTVIVRVLFQLFYLLFIIIFVGFSLTGRQHSLEVAQTVGFQSQFFNTALLVFLINLIVQLIGGFFMSGKYRSDSPYTYASFFGSRTLFLHVMIVSGVFIHKYFFEHKSYAATGEIVYVGLFMLIKTIIDLIYLRGRFAEHPGEIVMI